MTADEMKSDVNSVITNYGTNVYIKKYTIGYDSIYGTTSGVTLVGSAWCKGYQQPINLISRNGASDDIQFLEQGKIKLNDSKLYLAGSVNLSGNLVKIGVGSPTPIEYEILPRGVVPFYYSGEKIYQKAYIRILNTGSYIGE